MSLWAWSRLLSCICNLDIRLHPFWLTNALCLLLFIVCPKAVAEQDQSSADEDPRVETSWFIISHLRCVNLLNKLSRRHSFVSRVIVFCADGLTSVCMWWLVYACVCIVGHVLYVCIPLLLSVASCQSQVRSQDTNDDAHTHTHTIYVPRDRHPIHLEYYILIMIDTENPIIYIRNIICTYVKVHNIKL